MLVLLILFALSKINCEILSEELESSFKNVFCKAQCLKNFDEECNCSNWPKNLTLIPSNEQLNGQFKPKLLCRDETTLSFKWSGQNSSIYFVEFKANDWQFYKKTNKNFLQINNLKASERYQIRLWMISSENYVYGPFASDLFKTFSKGYVPSQVAKFDLFKWDLAGDSYNAILEWIPAEDRSCFYEILLLPEKDSDFSQHEILNIEELFRANLTDFKLGDNYSIGISSKSLDSQKESSRTWLNVTVPTCLETYQNLIQCVPLTPVHMEVTEKISKYYSPTELHPKYDVNVTWSTSKFIPDYYLVTIAIIEGENSTEVVQNITGSDFKATFYNVTLSSIYFVRLTAWSQAGGSTPLIIDKMLKHDIHVVTSTPHLNSTHISLIIGSAIGLLIVFILFGLLCYRRFKIMRTNLNNETMTAKYHSESYDGKFGSSLYNTTVDYYIPDDIVNDEWVINSDDIIVKELLGEGAFGIVHKGLMKKDGHDVEVAIKMLKGNSSVDEIRQFRQEISIMKSVGIHPHLVSLIGCCSKSGHWGPFLIVEYCENGDLQTYLRDIWVIVTSQTFEGNYVNSPINQQPKMENNFTNRSYELFGDKTIIEPKDLLSFSRQIAMGMEYLSNLRVVHRDLAARNVLMCPNGTVKIADFGLSRDVYQDNIYTKTGTGRLPVKWMAIESLTHQQYTSQSDVWSFGIVLWEIVTLGGNPYSAISASDLLDLLKKGYRMECPKNCGEALYEIMELCWMENPKERPTFTQLLEKLNILLANDNNYLTLDVRF